MSKDLERFWSKVDEYGPVHPVLMTRCYVWTGSKTKAGYGQFRLNGKMVSTHRYSYKQHVGGISEGMECCHKCDNPACVRPAHLFVGTRKDNALDCSKKGRTHAQTHPETLARGIAHGGVTTHPEKIREILLEYSRGNVSINELSRRFGIGEWSVSRWILGKTRSSETDQKLRDACKTVSAKRRMDRAKK